MSRLGTWNLRPGALAAKVALLSALVSGAHAAAQAASSLLHPPSLLLKSERPPLVGDVNGDGHVDLVGLHDQYAAPKLDVFLGDGLGGFSEPVVTGIASAPPILLDGGDFDLDGRMDVAFAVYSSATVQVLFGAGDGSFVDPATLPLAASGFGRDLTLCDATGDGILDIVGAYVTEGSASPLALYAGKGDGSFVAPPGQIVALNNPTFVTHGDFDGDSDIDLLAANDIETVVAWGHGDGLFDPPEILDGILLVTWQGISSVSKTTGDLDGDGRDDVVVELDRENTVLSWKPGVGFTGTTIPIPSDHYHPASVGAIADLDRDGRNELLLGYSGHTIELLAAEGPAGLAFVASYGTADYVSSLQVADIDEDGGLDVVVGGLFGNGTILAGQGDGELQNVLHFIQRPLDLSVADMTGDGFADLVAVFGPGKPAQMSRGRFDGGLDQPESIDVGPQAEQLFLVDATGDGELDLVTTGGAAIAVAAGHADGSFDPPVLSPVSEFIVHAQLAPFGGDGLPDLALLLKETPSYTAHHVHFLINGGGTFTDVGSTLVTPPGTDASRFLAADLDHDQDTDLIVRWNAGYVRLFINEPTGFVPGALHPVGGGLLIGAQDYDGDGHIDVADARSGGFEILSGDGAGGISATTTYPTWGLWPWNLTSVDLDGDGVLDRVVSGEPFFGYQDDLWVALGLSGGEFTPYTTWSTGSRSLILRTADVNGDGANDLLASMDDGALMVVENGEGPWSKLGHSLAGAEGFSRLQGFGPLTPGSPATVRVSNGQPGSPAILIAGMNEILAPFKGGVLVPHPTLIVPLGLLDADGRLQVTGIWPATMPHDATYSLQVWRPEVGSPSGFAATTAIRGMAP